MQEFAIFDFDGTITNLNVDWNSLKTEIAVEKISEIWNLEESQKIAAIKIISEYEIAGLSFDLIFDREYFELFQKFSILTNNSEETVARFFYELNRNSSLIKIKPEKIVGRSKLQGSKENEKIFNDQIVCLLMAMKIRYPSNCVYIGDQEYELEFAKKIGLETFHIREFQRMI
jgi:phosphoglycolate phosphatase-like HAD superfamily hydrolase